MTQKNPSSSDKAIQRQISLPMSKAVEIAYCKAKPAYYSQDCKYVWIDDQKPSSLDMEFKFLQNGQFVLKQAREFHAAVDLTGLVVTKLDGSGKGGIVIAIQHELGIPTRFIGTGERLEDLAPFDSRQFIEQML